MERSYGEFRYDFGNLKEQMNNPEADFEHFLLLAKRYGVKNFKANGIEVEFLDTSGPIIQAQQGEIPVSGMPTEDELLYWSSGDPPNQENTDAARLQKLPGV